MRVSGCGLFLFPWLFLSCYPLLAHLHDGSCILLHEGDPHSGLFPQ